MTMFFALLAAGTLQTAASSFSVDVDAQMASGRPLPNPAGVLTVWNGRGWTNRAEQAAYPVKGFVDWVELMACTGGNATRDLFRDRHDRKTLDDYDFTELVKTCREILAFGAKPYLKLGNVPPKFTADYDGGEFSMNIRPPTDALVHYRYMKACAAALRTAFGRDEVRSWRYAVLTEADNFGWFKAKSGDRAETKAEFFKLYDYTTKAFEEELGTGLAIGTHLLNPNDSGMSSFSVEDVIAHCVSGTNAATGKVGAPLKLLTISAYSVPDRDNPNAGKNYRIDRVTKALAAQGLQDVVTGVDEGRVIVCEDGGLHRKDLLQRVVGHSYQAAYDVRVTRELFDAGADYFASWGYFSGPDTLFGGIPSFSYFTARETAKFAGLRRAPVAVSGSEDKEQVDAIAAVSSDGRTVRIAVARFRDRLVFDTPRQGAVTVTLPKAFAGQKVELSVLTLDDRNNWFTHWYAHRGEDGITSKDFGWSGADPTIVDFKPDPRVRKGPNGLGLLDRKHVDLFLSKYAPRYSKTAASVKPVLTSVTVSQDGRLAIPLDFVGNGAAFVSVDVVPDRVVEEKSGYDLWGMRPKHVAVVNPVLGEDAANVVSLAGEWDFCAHEYRPERGESWEPNFSTRETWPNVRKIRVPGYVETQGVGAPGISKVWDCHWDCSPKPLKHVFYGAGWYRRTVKVPEAWKDRRIWFKVGDVTSQGWLWVNDTRVAWLESYCGTYKYEITDLAKPGAEIKIVLQVSNEVAKRGGTRNSANRWLGVPRELALEATPQVFIDDAWCRGDFDAQAAEVHVEVEKSGSGEVEKLSVRAEIEGETVEQDRSARDSRARHSEAGCARESRALREEETAFECVLRVPLARFRPWSPEHPNLYTAKVELVSADGKVLQTRRERFGVRKLEVRGKDFYLNGRPFFLRGIGYHNIQPVYGPSRIADRDYRRFEVKKLRDAGFNFTRTHTRCETPEFFDACDELGLMVQPELPYYTDLPCEKFEFNPVRDAKELFIHMRRHPSFAVYSHGNEGSFGPVLGEFMYKLIKAMDPDRLVIEQDACCFQSWKPDLTDLYNAKGRADFVGGPINEWPRGSAKPDRPMVAHEYLNLSVKANAELEDRYTGIWQTPFTRKMRAEFLAKYGLTDFWGKRLQLAQHALQAYWLKHGLEAARLDPECDGYFYWSANDCTTPATANGTTTYTAQGLFDPFWDEKPNGSTATGVAAYNSPCGVFCDTDPESRIVVSGEAVKNVIWFANYGETALPRSKLAWRLVAKKGGKVLVSDEGTTLEMPLGGIRRVGGISFNAPKVDAAVAAKLEVSLGGAKNAWDFWVFPKRGVKSAPGVAIVEPILKTLGPRYKDLVSPEKIAEAKIVVAPADSPAVSAALARGQDVISIGKADGAPDVKLGWWWLGDQVGTAMTDDAVFKYLPHAGELNPLWFRIFKKGEPLPLEGVSEKDLLVVCEGGFGCRYNLAVRRHGKAREFLVRGLDVCADLPEAKALLDGLILRF